MYEKKVRVRFSEVDESGFLTMGALLCIFQDLIFAYVADRNLGEEYTAKSGCTWFRLSWQIDVVKMPRVLEEVSLCTYITEVRESLVYMEIKMADKDGALLAIAKDMLAYVDIKTGAPRIQDEDIWPKEDFFPSAGHEFRGRRIPLNKVLPFNALPDFTVESHFLDLNGHANNVRLIEKALELSGLENYDVKFLRAEFKNQIKGEERITPSICAADGVTKIQFKNGEGLLCNLFEFSVLDYVDFI